MRQVQVVVVLLVLRAPVSVSNILRNGRNA